MQVKYHKTEKILHVCNWENWAAVFGAVARGGGGMSFIIWCKFGEASTYNFVR